jgi:catechol 2,3-dioxygenase-like lactoylglutathione lyase family enzyme
MPPVPLPPPVLDHVVIDVRDRMDEAARVLTALGFTLTPRGHHTLGSMNHLAMFATDYLELLGFGSGANRPELASFPVGLNGLVFKTEDADAVYAHAEAAGLPILPVQSFSRPVALSDGSHDARFRTTRLDPAKSGPGRVYFCEHLTPELVWRPEWQSHANGAHEIARVVVATAAPRRAAALFAALFGPQAVAEEDGGCLLRAGTARVELTTPDAVAGEFGDAAAAVASGREPYLAALELKVASLAATAERLRGLAGVRIEPGRIVVPAHAAFNTTLVFTQ